MSTNALPPNGDPEVEAFIRQHFKHLDTNDANVIAPDFLDSCAVVDAFPPFLWSGPAAITRWWSEMRETIKPFGLKEVAFHLGDWQRVYAKGDCAFVAAFASAIISGPEFAVEAKGTLTFVLNRVGGNWKIASWNWGGPPAAPLTR